MSGSSELESMWARHSAEWRDTAQVASQWADAARVDPGLLRSRVRGDWWDIIDSLSITLFVTREYEHLVMALTVDRGVPRATFLPLPHPSGIAVNRTSGELFVASTRNPNQVFVYRPVRRLLARTDMDPVSDARATMAPASSRYYPGSLYLHDLALLGGELYGNAVGHNAVAKLLPDGRFEYAWWPKCVESKGRPVHSVNYLQMNSLAAGKTLQESFFSASGACMGQRRPGHLNYPVDRRGVIFSGKTREPICTGLTRPHSARLAGGKLWVANSGYGEAGFVSDGRFETVRRLPGWTRGLCVLRDVLFVATSRIIPRFSRYAPGVDAADSKCALFALSSKTGEILGSLEWPGGNQIFAIDWMQRSATNGFPFEVGARRQEREKRLFYAYLAG